MVNQTDYFIWLTAQIEIPNNKTYNDLFTKLHETEFHWIIPRDDNRLEDAVELRQEFVHNRRNDIHKRPVSLLEVLIALSRRVSWTTDRSPEFWAWHLLENLKVDRSSDPLTERKAQRIDHILETLIWRTYEPNGEGGFFPLKHPQDDQTKREIWDQMNAYVNEMYKP